MSACASVSRRPKMDMSDQKDNSKKNLQGGYNLATRSSEMLVRFKRTQFRWRNLSIFKEQIFLGHVRQNRRVTSLSEPFTLLIALHAIYESFFY